MNKETKVCTKCGEKKFLSQYPTDRSKSDGTRPNCKDCESGRKKVWNENNFERRMKKCKEWVQNNRQRSNQIKKKYSDKNRGWERERGRKYYHEHKEERLEYSKIWANNKYHSDPLYRLKLTMRNNLLRCFKDNRKEGRTVEYLGYDSVQLKKRLECQFQPGMTWNNHGDWEIDHKIPIQHFLNKGETRPHIINALSNLQPLWKDENRSKNDTLPEVCSNEV